MSGILLAAVSMLQSMQPYLWIGWVQLLCYAVMCFSLLLQPPLPYHPIPEGSSILRSSFPGGCCGEEDRAEVQLHELSSTSANSEYNP